MERQPRSAPSLIKCFGVFLTSVFLFAASAHAVQSVKVQGDSAQVFAQPGTASDVIEDVPGGTQIPASSKPTRGFYKVKTPGGKIGWMSAESLGLPADGGGDVQPPPPPQAAAPEEARPTRRTRQSSRSSRSNDHNFGIKALAGITMFKLDNINTAYGITEMGTAMGFGAELKYRLNPHWVGLFRFETFSKSVEIQVTSTSQLFTLKAAATPIELGAQYGFMDDPRAEFQVGFAGLLGFGMGSKFSSTAEGATAPNETIYSSSPIILHFKLDADYYFAPTFSLGAEIGYRIHKIAEAVPTTAGATTSSDPLKSGSGFLAEAVNLGGLTLGFGLTLWF